MSWRRILLGGLVAGVLIDGVEGGLSGLIVGNRFQGELGALGVHPQLSAAAGLFFASWGFIVGLVTVWLYAAVRPRLGPGPRTALLVALAVWIVHSLLPHLRDAALGLFSLQLCLELAAIQLAWQIAATLLGAAICREKGGP